jgi:hypothetical protein
MKLPIVIKRRVFLGSLLVLGAASGPMRQLRWKIDNPPVMVAERLAALFPHRESAARVGREYLRGHPQEASTTALVAHLTRNLDVLASEFRMMSELDLRVHMNQRSQADFRARQVVKVDGWVLSETEARLCALTSLV